LAIVPLPILLGLGFGSLVRVVLKKVFLSIIIPAHNEEKRLPPSLIKIDQFLRSQPFTYEVLVVENGSQDATLAVAKAHIQKMPYLRVFQEKKRGKGLAIQQGMLEAVGDYRFICDADLSMPIEQVLRFLPPALESFDIAIASRELPDSVRYDEPDYRHLIGRIFNTAVRWLVLPGLQDTQCGFKCFRADVAESVFPLQTLCGMSFDAEVLFIARRQGYQIEEVPVDWYFDPNSRVRLIRDSFQMWFDLFTIRLNALRGRYES